MTVSRLRTDEERWETAFHEGGHAVGVLLRGGKFIGSEVYTASVKSEHEGRVRTGVTRHDVSDSDREFVAFCGPWAEARRKRMYNHSEAWKQRVIRLAVLTNSDRCGDPRNHPAWARELEGYWPVVKAAAATLFRAGRLDLDGLTAAVATGAYSPSYCYDCDMQSLMASAITSGARYMISPPVVRR